jgi:hypothetical protein
MVATSGRQTIQETADDHAMHPFQVSHWKRHLLNRANELFTRGKKPKDKEEGQAREAELFQQIRRLHLELEWLNKCLSSPDTRALRKLVDHDRHKLNVTR